MEKLNQIIEEEISRGNNISVVNLIDHLIRHAIEVNASDIHVDPLERTLRVRFRIDGVLENSCDLPKNIHSEIIARIKVLSHLRTDEHQATQDGRFRHLFLTQNSQEQFVDLRVSVVPTYHGENAVIRLLRGKVDNFNLENLGFSQGDQEKILSALRKPSGMILATGPTGSGKTTTLYTLIKILNSSQVSIVTIEDPIEYSVDGIEQIQVNSRHGLTFANGLRSILRQDPNIVMVGEIRDGETAGIAVNTALTGHLLLSTLHTSDAATTLPRLLDMGIEEYLVSSTISIAIGQRLVRKICLHCKEEYALSESLKENLRSMSKSSWFAKMENQGENNLKLYRGKGCKKCNKTGYAGRISINEVLVADEIVREAILRKASAAEIKALAISRGMTTMLEDGFQKVQQGVTTLEEILRVAHE